jgi:glutathione S-transferase
MAELELYNSAVCPFAQRVRLALLEKAIPFKTIEIDLQRKPKNFQDISPYGKVPVLKHGAHRVWESAIINEYLDDAFPEPPLLPRSPIRRAQARIWINFADSRLFATTGSLLYAGEPSLRPAFAKDLADQLRFLEQESLQHISDKEPYWLGKEVSLVDLTYYPWFEQLVVLEKFRDFTMPEGLPRLRAWRETMATRESVQAIARPPDFYIEHYAQRQAQLV